MGLCKRGISGCPGVVPYTRSQCRQHRIHARVKAKIALSHGEDFQNPFVRAILSDRMPVVHSYEKVQNRSCRKECCQVQKVNAKDPSIPGLEGLNPDKLQSSQPLLTSSKWDYKGVAPCKMTCCASSLPVTLVHDQVTFITFDMLIITSYYRIITFFLLLSSIPSRQLVILLSR